MPSSQSVLITDDAALRRCRRRGGRRAAQDAAARRDRRRELARPWLRSSWCRTSTAARRSSTASPPSMSRSRWTQSPRRRSASRSRHAGAIFIGRHTPEAIGDYVAGTNHVLPTSRAARFSGGPRRARLPEAHLDRRPARRSRLPRWLPRRWRWPRPRASTRTAARSRSG